MRPSDSSSSRSSLTGPICLSCRCCKFHSGQARTKWEAVSTGRLGVSMRSRHKPGFVKVSKYGVRTEVSNCKCRSSGLVFSYRASCPVRLLGSSHPPTPHLEIIVGQCPTLIA